MGAIVTSRYNGNHEYPTVAEVSGTFGDEYRSYRVSYKRQVLKFPDHVYGVKEELSVQRTDKQTKEKGFTVQVEDVKGGGRIGSITYGESGPGTSFEHDNKMAFEKSRILTEIL
jgi:hypothetical protein